MKRKIIPDLEFLSKLGSVIRSFRQRRELSQPGFCKKLKMSQSSSDRYEKGQSNIPVLALKDISDAYDIKIEDFFIEMDRPSDMFKTVASIKTGGRRKHPQRIKGDESFDEYMKKPENVDKLQALYHSYRLSEYVPEDINEQIFTYFKDTITTSPQHDLICGDLIIEYMGRVSRNSKGED